MAGLVAQAPAADGAAVTEPDKGGEPRRRIDAAYYDRSSYFDSGTGHLTDLGSAFQRYRVAKVLGIYDPAPDERVVDLGCGWGTFEWVLAARVDQIVGVDFSAKSIEICERRRSELGLRNVRFVHADAGATHLAADSFDLVIAADLFEHLYAEDSARVVAEAGRILKRGGRFTVWTPHRGHILEVLKNRGILLKPDPTHVDYKSIERMRKLLVAEGFALEKAYYAESHLPGLRAVERTLMGALPILRRRIAMLARKT
jgi:ubiquinone/menaquinone biosynthesis C-methylase UbiE